MAETVGVDPPVCRKLPARAPAARRARQDPLRHRAQGV